jgi:hypothetical protein
MGILDTENPAYTQSMLSPPSMEPPTPDNYGDFFKFRLDNMDILEEIEHHLKGEVFIEGRWVEKCSRQLSDEGVKDILSIIYSMGINKNVILGCLTHEEIYGRCRAIWLEISKYFVTDGFRIGINKNRRGILVKEIVFMIHSSLSRSEEGKEANQISTASQRIEHFVKEDKGKQDKFRLPFFGRK